MLGHKTSLNKFKNSEIMSSIFSNYNGLKLETSYKKKTGKFTYMRRLNNMPLNNQRIKKEIKREITYLETNKNGNTIYQNIGIQQKEFHKGSS